MDKPVVPIGPGILRRIEDPLVSMSALGHLQSLGPDILPRGSRYGQNPGPKGTTYTYPPLANFLSFILASHLTSSLLSLYSLP